MKIGIFSTFIEPAALELVQAVRSAVRDGVIPDTKISFIFSNRELGESPITDSILRQLYTQEAPLTTLSARRFEPELREQAKKEGIKRNFFPMREWRNRFGAKTLDSLPSTDLDLLLGDMYIWGENMCKTRNGINLHPALPNGPKGEWYNVIWDLIQNKDYETGVMMHKVTPELDRGPSITYCSFPIRGYQFDNLWNQLPEDPEKSEKFIQQGRMEKEKTQHLLHEKIRKYGLTREFPLVIQTAKAFAEGAIRIAGQSLVDHEGKPIEGGYDLTGKIDKIVKPQLEGNVFAQKEVRR